MKGKINIKSIVILAVVLVVIVLGVVGAKTVQTFMSGASGDFEPSGMTAVSADDGKTATISWTSDKESLAKVEYGTTAASLVLMAADSSSVTAHRVSLSSLRPGTTYYYRIRVADEVFDNSGIPYTFKTKGSSKVKVSSTPTVSIVPMVSNGIQCDSGVDYNKDGVVNSMDLLMCRKNGGTISTSSSTPIPTSSAAAVCNNSIDYNSDGVVNSLDRINCLQSLN